MEVDNTDVKNYPKRLQALATKIVVYPPEYVGFLKTASQLFYAINQYKELITTYDNMYKYYIETTKKKLEEKINSVLEVYYNCAKKFDNLEEAYKSYEPSSKTNELTDKIHEIVNLSRKINKIENYALFKFHATKFFYFSGSLLHTVYHFYEEDDVNKTMLQEMINNFLNYVKEIDAILEIQEETKRAMSSRHENENIIPVRKGFFNHLGDVVSEFFGAGEYIPPKSRRRSRRRLRIGLGTKPIVGTKRRGTKPIVGTKPRIGSRIGSRFNTRLSIIDMLAGRRRVDDE